MKCIYCLEDRPDNYFTKTEHVLSQSFGKFNNNLTLNKLVCDVCNQYFGDNLEISLGRDTFEGMARFEHNVKKANEFKSLGKKSRLKIKVNEGPLKGAYAYREYSEQEGTIITNPLPQVGFKLKTSANFDFFLIDKVPPKEDIEKNYDLKEPKSIVLLGCNVEEAQRHLSEKGISFKVDSEGHPLKRDTDWEFEVTGKIDQIILRSIAKIAFNYLTYWAGREFVIDNPFHPIRRYIRYGEKTSFPFVVIIEKAILGDEPIEGKRRLGHLITLDWSNNKLSIASQVSLFNWMTYLVLLAKDYKGKQFNIRKGNFFNIADNEIIELVPGDMISAQEQLQNRK